MTGQETPLLSKHCVIEAHATLRRAVAAALQAVPGAIVLLNAEAAPAAEVVVARAVKFASCVPEDKEALIVTLLRQPPAGLDHLAGHEAAASLWAFTRQAALEWAPRRIRVNAIALGGLPADTGPQDSQAAFAMPAPPATEADIARVMLGMVRMASMTGQLIRLGG
jgi:NAD(P)-dependent dehydrogenase (short-subunit alcohol dehydrogenase family)